VYVFNFLFFFLQSSNDSHKVEINEDTFMNYWTCSNNLNTSKTRVRSKKQSYYVNVGMKSCIVSVHVVTNLSKQLSPGCIVIYIVVMLNAL